MNPVVLEWLKKAEGDWNSANRELRARKNPNYDAACFHAQQCAEKYLKAFLQWRDHRFGKTHDLIALMETCSNHEPQFELHRDILNDLSKYAVLFRYPGEDAQKIQAAKLLSHWESSASSFAT